MDLIYLLIWSIFGYIIGLGIDATALKLLFKNSASFTSIAFFEWIHNLFTFLAGLFLGLNILSLNVGYLLIDLAFIGGWFIFSFVLVIKILGMHSKLSALSFLGLDTAMDYGLGSLISIPASLTLLSAVPVQSTNNIAATLVPLSFRPLVIIFGFLLVLGIVLYKKSREEEVELTAES